MAAAGCLHIAAPLYKEAAMTIAAMLEPIAGNGETVTLPADEWMQGRTLYGGARR